MVSIPKVKVCIALVAHIISITIMLFATVYGLLMIIPAGPFKERDLSTGIILLFLGIVWFIGYLFGLYISPTICAPHRLNEL